MRETRWGGERDEGDKMGGGGEMRETRWGGSDEGDKMGGEMRETRRGVER